MILVVDFGSQTAHLIARRIKDIGAPVRFVLPHEALALIEKEKPKGIIFSGGPSSVYQKGAPTIDKRIFDLHIPILAICYGFQLTAQMLGGKVVGGKKEYGPATLKMENDKWKMENKLPKQFTVWMSHGDEIISLPREFEVIGSTEHVPHAFAVDQKRNITGLLFHPEVEHTENGLQILQNFIDDCAIEDNSKIQGEIKNQKSKIKITEIKNNIKNVVGEKDYVIGAVSGGVDSTVAGLITAQAIGERFIPVYVENGLMRQGTAEHVQKIFKKHHRQPIVINSVGETLLRLRGISDSEQKRKIIGALYIEKFEQQMDKLKKSGKNVEFLMQGTIYSDVIESGGQRGPAEVRRSRTKEDKGTKYADKIKSHHNVGGLPKRLKLQLLEPLRGFYKDEVREIGKRLGLPDDFIWKQVFPGPGYAVRIRGEVTKERLSKAKQADAIVLQEIERAGLMSEIYMSFPVLTGASSTAVKGDGRFFGEVIALRIIESRDVMTATWARLPYDLLQRISSRIVNEVPGISRVVYDITTKPPATMEWE